MENLLSVGLPALDFARPRGAAGETTGYLFPTGGGDAAGFGDRSFLVALLDRQIANGIIVARHYSARVYRGSTLHLGVWIDGALLGVLQWRLCSLQTRQFWMRRINVPSRSTM